MFKRILFATGIVLAVVAACDKPKQPEKEDPKVTLSVFPTSHTFEASSPEAFLVSVSCTGDWTATPSDTWITVSPASGNGNASVTVKVSANSGEARTGNVTFQDKEKTHDLIGYSDARIGEANYRIAVDLVNQKSYEGLIPPPARICSCCSVNTAAAYCPE